MTPNRDAVVTPNRDAVVTVTRTAVVTGANSGLGLASVRALARQGLRVVMACRSVERGEAARQAVLAGQPAADLVVLPLDLSRLADVEAFAQRLPEVLDGPVDVLLANAGVMLVPEQTLTADGHELHWGVNHLGHFALVGRLLPLLAPTAAVVALSSIAHRSAGRWDRRCNLGEGWTPSSAYAQSKLCTLMTALELDRRLRASGSGIRSVAAHPGWSATDPRPPRERGDDPSTGVVLARRISQLLGSSPQEGARSQVHAATDPAVTGGQYWGPRFLLRGRPRPAGVSRWARHAEDAAVLVALSEKLTGVVLPGS